MAHASATTNTDIDAVLGRWREAELAGDVSELQALLNDDFMGIGPLGFVLRKSQWIGRYASGDLSNEALDLDEVYVRRFGETAIVTGIQSQRTLWRGAATPGRFRFTLVILGVPASSIAHVQLSAIAEPPAGAQ